MHKIHLGFAERALEKKELQRFWFHSAICDVCAKFLL